MTDRVTFIPMDLFAVADIVTARNRAEDALSECAASAMKGHKEWLVWKGRVAVALGLPESASADEVVLAAERSWHLAQGVVEGLLVDDGVTELPGAWTQDDGPPVGPLMDAVLVEQVREDAEVDRLDAEENDPRWFGDHRPDDGPPTQSMPAMREPRRFEAGQTISADVNEVCGKNGPIWARDGIQWRCQDMLLPEWELLLLAGSVTEVIYDDPESAEAVTS